MRARAVRTDLTRACFWDTHTKKNIAPGPITVMLRRCQGCNIKFVFPPGLRFFFSTTVTENKTTVETVHVSTHAANANKASRRLQDSNSLIVDIPRQRLTSQAEKAYSPMDQKERCYFKGGWRYVCSTGIK